MAARLALLTALLLLALAPAAAAAPARGALQPPPVAVPLPVLKTRELIIKLAEAGKYEELEAVAMRAGRTNFTFHSGFEKHKPATFWRAEARKGEEPLKKLIGLLKMPYAMDEGTYLWPAAALANPSDADWTALKAIYPAARVLRYKADGYTGWRVGIDSQGNWKFFIHGD